MAGPGGGASGLLADLKALARQRLAAQHQQAEDDAARAAAASGGGGVNAAAAAAAPAPAPPAAPPKRKGRWDEEEEEEEDDAGAGGGAGATAVAAAKAAAAAAAVAERRARPGQPPPPASAAERAMAEAAAFSAAMGTTGMPFRAAPPSPPSPPAVEVAEEEAAPVAQPSPPPPPQAAPPPAPPRPPPPLRPRRPSTSSCRSVEEFERLGRVAEGTYGVVYRARDTATGQVVALKKIKLGGGGSAHPTTGEVGFPLTALREVTTLLACDHPAIVGVSEVVVGGGGKGGGEAVYLVMEWADHDLAGLASAAPRRFSIPEIKTIMLQLASGLAYLHARWVLHRDIKPANILYAGTGGRVMLADFGLARPYGSPLRPYTRPVVTLYYRAPELLLGAPTYATPIDVWSLGCVMGELLLGRGAPLFEARAGRGGPAAGELAQLAAITGILGPIDEGGWPGCSALPGLASMQYTRPGAGLRSLFPAPGPGGTDASTRLSAAGMDLLARMLRYAPEDRISAAEITSHPWFAEFPVPTPGELMPTYPSTQAGRGGR